MAVVMCFGLLFYILLGFRNTFLGIRGAYPGLPRLMGLISLVPLEGPWPSFDTVPVATVV